MPPCFIGGGGALSPRSLALMSTGRETEDEILKYDNRQSEKNYRDEEAEGFGVVQISMRCSRLLLQKNILPSKEM